MIPWPEQVSNMQKVGLDLQKIPFSRGAYSFCVNEKARARGNANLNGGKGEFQA
ncbi:hypothetical protein GCM10007107_07500 [Shewanella indica]|nr:hypothetical protein GCM10007107_07500 [Shewanella indica]